jgi:glutamate 5-kinase
MRKLPNINTLVVKVGSSLLANEKGVNEAFINNIASVLSFIKGKIPHIIVVSSGAVAAGFKTLGYADRPKDIIDKQVCAAVGQAKLIWLYEQAFEKYKIPVAQVLVTKDDFANRRRFLNVRYSLRKMLKLGIVPVINENDIVVIDELKYVETFGDNDNLSALVAGLIEADLLLILSDVDGVYYEDPKKSINPRLIDNVESINTLLKEIELTTVSPLGSGGMKSKIMAAKKALSAGCYVGIINGNDLSNIRRFLSGENVGTYFSGIGKNHRLSKMWLAYATITKGSIVIDDGAVKAIVDDNKSLLPGGIISVNGRFNIGDVVVVTSQGGVEIARGKVRYSSQDVFKIAGVKSNEIYDKLGYKYSDEVIHKDDLIVTVDRISEKNER